MEIRERRDDIEERGITIYGMHFPIKQMMGGDLSHAASVYKRPCMGWLPPPLPRLWTTQDGEPLDSG